MKKNRLYYRIDQCVRNHRYKPRPKNVEKQVKRYRETKDRERRRIIYQYIELERLVACGRSIKKEGTMYGYY